MRVDKTVARWFVVAREVTLSLCPSPTPSRTFTSNGTVHMDLSPGNIAPMAKKHRTNNERRANRSTQMQFISCRCLYHTCNMQVNINRSHLFLFPPRYAAHITSSYINLLHLISSVCSPVLPKTSSGVFVHKIPPQKAKKDRKEPL